MKQSILLSLSLLFVLTCTSHGSDKGLKGSIAPETTTAPKMGPIARATRFIAPLVDMIVAYRGPFYKNGMSFVCKGNPLWYDKNIYEKALSYIKQTPDGGFDVYRVFRNKKSKELSFYISKYGNNFRSSGSVSSAFCNPGPAGAEKEKELLKELYKQAEITASIRQNRGEIPMDIDSETAALQLANGTVVVATVHGGFEQWPPSYGDLEPEPKESICAIS